MKKQTLKLSLILFVLISIYAFIELTPKHLYASPIRYCRCHILPNDCMEGNMFSIRPRCSTSCTIVHPCDINN